MVYKIKRAVFRDDNGTYEEIGNYLRETGFKKIGGGFTETFYGEEIGAVSLRHDLETFNTTIRIGASNESLEKNLLEKFPRLEFKDARD